MKQEKSRDAMIPARRHASALCTAFEQAVALNPESVAIQQGTSTMSYGQALDRIQERARTLASAEVVRIALCLSRGPEVVLWQLSAARTGSTFAVLDPAWPMPRIALAAEHSCAQWLVGDASFDFSAYGWKPVGRKEGVCQTWRSTKHEPGEGHWEGASHVFFSSGSSGEPKSVHLEAHPVVEVALAQARLLGIGQGSRCAWALSPGFDASLSDVYSCLLSGATLLPFSGKTSQVKTLAEFLNQTKATHVDLPPALLGAIDPTTLESLQCVVFGGELAGRHAAKAWRDADKRVFNAYGPTEASICTHMAMTDDEWEPDMIGIPLPGVEARIYGQSSWRFPEPGMRGELAIMGEHVALGYGNRKLSTERFGQLEGQRLFKTGDVFSVDERGRLRFSGRIDRQFKNAGALVSPEEIEASALSSGCSQAKVHVESGRIHLTYCGTIGAAQLMASLACALPKHMLPHRMSRVDQLASGPTGKSL